MNSFTLIKNREPLSLLRKIVVEMEEAHQSEEFISTCFYISFCPWRRAQIRLAGKNCLKTKWIAVDPRTFKKWGSSRFDYVIWDEWLSFTGKKWDELRFFMLGEQGVKGHVLTQHIGLKCRPLFSWALLKDSFGVDLGKRFFITWNSLSELVHFERVKLPKVFLFPSSQFLKSSFIGGERFGFLMAKQKEILAFEDWEYNGPPDLHCLLDLSWHSEVFSDGRFFLRSGTLKRDKAFLWVSYLETFIYWLLCGPGSSSKKLMLLSEHENKARGDLNQEDSLSGQAHHWDIAS